MEKRLLLAFVLSAAILLAWSILFPPPAPVRPQPRPETAEEVAPAAAAVPTEVPGAASELVTDAALGAEVEETIELANDHIAVTLTNRGAAVSSYRLAGYQGDGGEAVDLVQTVPLAERALPLQLITASGPDSALYAVERDGEAVVFRWADGLGAAVTKRIALAGESYGLEVAISTAGERRAAAVSIGTGLRDLGAVERDNRLALWGEGIVNADGEIDRFKRAKLKEPRVLTPGQLAFAGLEGAYFVGLLLPDTPVAELRFEPLEYTEGEAKPTRVLRVSVLPRDGELRGQYLGAPKEYDLVRRLGRGLEETLDFGFFGPISVFFLKALRWIYSHVGNYGTAIILLTVGIRILLFPLMHTSTVSMRKMAKVQPKVKEIQARYKKKKADPQARAKMNQEMMALYKQEGINPMAGCLPLLVQLPLLWALYQLFLRAIELRHAPFALWITDLSAKDPYYVTPILMTATMWLQQHLAPQVGDPQQQRLMRMMPLIFGIMFLQFPSGLVLYWLTNNVITIIQQELTLHLVGERKLGGWWRSRKDSGR
ncbi:MAG: membrane protein insertase YidC [Thermoanaerobaculales bacterium]|jgi:YidC/Oxa1 family membrane protein insertase|nr:membrane protein insertase YidC [Thermoanaerobaculales bacterium]